MRRAVSYQLSAISRKTRKWGVVLIAALSTAMVFASGAFAGSVSAEVSSRETQVGVPIVLQVVVVDAAVQQPPVVPEIPDVKVRSRGVPSQNSQMSIIAGAVSKKETLTYQYELTPTKPGAFTIPALSMQIDGKVKTTEPIKVIVTKSETGDLLFVEIKGSRKRLYVGESLAAKLQIWIRPLTDQQYGKLNEASMWSCVDKNGSQWGSFLEPLQQLASRGQELRGSETIRKDSQWQDRSYYLFEVERTIQVNRPGKLAMEDVNIVMNYPSRLGQSTDVFSMGRLGIVSATRISGQAKVEPIDVLPVPTEGRPAWYSGAVGRYQVSASAKPTDVAVGDPITLTLVVSGTGNLQDLQPPPLATMPELTNGFRVPSDPLAGEMAADGKHFSVSIRAISESIKQIPSIPFAYFDPQQEKFATVRTEPIALQVKTAQKLSMSQIVDSGARAAPQGNRLTESTSGILANYMGMDEVLRQEAFSPGPTMLLAVVLPPVGWVVSWVAVRRRERLRTDVRFARRRKARRDALRRLQSGKDGDREVAAAVSGALGQYMADRCNLPAGGMTRASIVELLRSRLVTPQLVDEIDGLLSECEAVHYAGAGARTATVLQQAAVQCIERLERERWQ